MTPKQRESQRKRRVIEYAEQIGNVRKACRYYDVAKSTFYLWRARYREFGDEDLMNRRRAAHIHPKKTPAEVVEKLPFRIRTIRTDRGHEFQALFHWHVADLGVEHAYIKPLTPQLNGNAHAVPLSHRLAARLRSAGRRLLGLDALARSPAPGPCGRTAHATPAASEHLSARADPPSPRSAFRRGCAASTPRGAAPGIPGHASTRCRGGARGAGSA